MPQPWIILPASGSDQADEWVRLGVESQMSGQLPLAKTRYEQALRIDPRHAIALQNLAIVYSQSNLPNEALLTIERAEMMDGKQPIIATNHALMALEAERIDEALVAARRAVEIAPRDASGNPARLSLAMAHAVSGHPELAIPLYEEMLDYEPKHPAAGPNLCFVGTLADSTPEDLLRARKRWYEANRYDGPKQPHDNDRRLDRPLRVGYVGGDFKSHSAAFIFSAVLLHHTQAVEMYLYSTLPVSAKDDIRTQKFMDAAGSRWRDVSAMSDDAEVERLIRRDRIDILVDLAGHTNGGRLALFTRKPAPVAVTMHGFAHGTGCGSDIDYFFADPIAVPEAERKWFAEKIIDLPCIVTIEPPTDYNLRADSIPPFRKNGYFTFGANARFEKMSDDCIKAFGEILRRTGDTKLQFKDHSLKRPFSIRRIMGLMPDVAPERLLFSTASSHPDHLLAVQQNDLILDCWPHGAGVVSLETLYMSVPLLTRIGRQPSGRTASSVLTAMGRTEWVASTTEEYIDKAVALAEDPKPLMAARKTLRQELLDSPVHNGYVAAVENAYREAWKEWCKS